MAINWGLRKKIGDFQRNKIRFALLLEFNNGYMGEIEAEICICFENREQNHLRVNIFSNWIIH